MVPDLKVNNATLTKTRLMYARVSVDMNMAEGFPIFSNERAELISQRVQYDWTPTWCTKCAQFGHVAVDCRVGLHRASKSQLEVDEHGFRPFKKTYHPKSQTIQQPLDKELEVLQQSKPTHSASIPPSPQVAPIQQSPVQQPTPSQ